MPLPNAPDSHLLRRRSLLTGAALGMATPAWLAGCASPVTGPASKPIGPAAALDPADIALLNRVTWGIDSVAIDDWARGSRRDYLQRQLHPAKEVTLPAVVQAQIDGLVLGQRSMEAWVAEMELRRRNADATASDEAKKAVQQAYQKDMNGLARDAATRTLLNALYSPNQLQEQLTWFWFNHFNVHQYKANLRAMVGDYEGQLRVRALGRFRDLLIASATHVAMIRYLDNEQNAANRINENFAREPEAGAAGLLRPPGLDRVQPGAPRHGRQDGARRERRGRWLERGHR
jgi:hypothetical protein